MCMAAQKRRATCEAATKERYRCLTFTSRPFQPKAGLPRGGGVKKMLYLWSNRWNLDLRLFCLYVVECFNHFVTVSQATHPRLKQLRACFTMVWSASPLLDLSKASSTLFTSPQPTKPTIMHSCLSYTRPSFNFHFIKYNSNNLYSILPMNQFLSLFSTAQSPLVISQHRPSPVECNPGVFVHMEVLQHLEVHRILTLSMEAAAN